MTVDFGTILAQTDYSPTERHNLARLMALFAQLPAPPDPYHLYPQYSQLKKRFLESIDCDDADTLEEAFLALYSHIHGYDVPYTSSERSRVKATRGYLNHPGGLSPIVKAGPFINPETISGDFGAGNGLQGLLLQFLFPHLKVIQIEISSRLVEAGRQLQAWLGIDKHRVVWRTEDIIDVSPKEMTFIYLYRPVRPIGEGRLFYERFAEKLDDMTEPVVIFSVADCLREFLSTKFEVIYDDGHLTCFERKRSLAERQRTIST